jgi:hypothetical protein
MNDTSRGEASEVPPVVALRQVLESLKQHTVSIEDAKRAVGAYCRERHQEGAKPETVLVEIKRLAVPILFEDYAKVETLVKQCVMDFYAKNT